MDKLIRQLQEIRLDEEDLFPNASPDDIRGRREILKQRAKEEPVRVRELNKSLFTYLGTEQLDRVTIDKLTPLVAQCLSADARLVKATISVYREHEQHYIFKARGSDLTILGGLYIWPADDLGQRPRIRVDVSRIRNSKTGRTSTSNLQFYYYFSTPTPELTSDYTDTLKKTLDRLSVPKGQFADTNLSMPVEEIKDNFIVVSKAGRKCSLCSSTIVPGEKLFFWSAGSQSANLRMCKRCINELPRIFDET